MDRIGIRTFSWLGFFALILWAWWVMYSMAADMGRVPMNMHDFGPLLAMWATLHRRRGRMREQPVPQQRYLS